MRLAYKILLTSAAAFLLSVSLPAANPDNGLEFTKTIKKDFPISLDGATTLHNQYGKVDVRTWDQSRVKIEVTIRVRASSEAKAQQVFDEIFIEFQNTPASVKAETLIESGKKSWWSWGSNERDFNIDYEVYLPPSNNLEVQNKYGNVVVGVMDGTVDLMVKYGNVDLEGVKNQVKLDLAYGNGQIAQVGDLNASLAYCNLTLQKAANVNSVCKYSKFTVGEAKAFRIESKYNTLALGTLEDFQLEGKYDNIVVQKLNNLQAVSKYTDFRVKTVGNSADLDLEYGSVDFETVERGFGEIRLVGRYTDYKLHVEEGASYQLDATADYAGIIYPDGMNITYEMDKGVYHEVEGHMGTKNARSVIKARLDYGGLKVR